MLTHTATERDKDVPPSARGVGLTSRGTSRGIHGPAAAAAPRGSRGPQPSLVLRAGGGGDDVEVRNIMASPRGTGEIAQSVTAAMINAVLTA